MVDDKKVSATKVRVINAYVGGALGSKGTMTPRTTIIAAISRRLGRPVKLVVARDQGFTVATFRAETRHQIKLARDTDTFSTGAPSFWAAAWPITV